jgi:hypothetical protein
LGNKDELHPNQEVFSMPVSYIQHKGKTILYVDYRNMTGEQTKEAIEILEEEARELRTWSQKGLVLTDFRNAKASQEYMTHAKKLGKEVFADKIQKSAALGITGVKSILLQAYNAFSKDKIVPFDSEEEAKEWLVKD